MHATEHQDQIKPRNVIFLYKFEFEVLNKHELYRRFIRQT